MPTSLFDLRSALDAGRSTSQELTKRFLDAITAHNDTLGCYLHVHETALSAARDADRRRAAGESLPLLGVPIAVKDIFVTQDMPTTCASRILEGFNSPYESAATQRLRDAGAILLGKTNMDEFAMGSSNESSAYRLCRNPWDTTRNPGGSSGGSAAAVAAGLAPAALGTDTGGSVRQPAAFCGVVGLKPTYGRISRYGMVAFASSLDQAGVLTQTSRDAALLLQVLAGHDPRDSTSSPRPVPDYSQSLHDGIEGLTLGVPAEYFAPGLEPEIEDAVRTAIDQLESAGARVLPVSLPHTRYAIAAYYLICTAEASSNLARYDGVRYGYRSPNAHDLHATYTRTRTEALGPEVQRRIMLGNFVLSEGYYEAYYGRAQKTRTLIRRDFEAAFEQVDLIVTPTTPTTAFPLGERTEDPVQMYLSDILTISCNLAGLPGLSLPCGQDSAGLPMGLQLLGRPFDEATLLRAAHAYETLRGPFPSPRLEP